MAEADGPQPSFVPRASADCWSNDEQQTQPPNSYRIRRRSSVQIIDMKLVQNLSNPSSTIATIIDDDVKSFKSACEFSRAVVLAFPCYYKPNSTASKRRRTQERGK